MNNLEKKLLENAINAVAKGDYTKFHELYESILQLKCNRLLLKNKKKLDESAIVEAFPDDYSNEDSVPEIPHLADRVNHLVKILNSRLMNQSEPAYRRKITAKIGKVWTKLISNSYNISTKSFDGNSTSVFGFIENSTGKIYKAASWNAPYKGSSRGSITNPDFGVSSFTDYGVNYAR